MYGFHLNCISNYLEGTFPKKRKRQQENKNGQSDSEDNSGYEGTHVKHRKITEWIQQGLPALRLIEHIPNKYPYRGDYRDGSFADFFIYERA